MCDKNWNDTELLQIPDDLMRQIFTYLNISHILPLLIVSKCMKSFVRESLTSLMLPYDCHPFRKMYTSNKELTIVQLQNILDRFHNLRTVILSGIQNLSDSFFPILNRCKAAPLLEHVEVHGCYINSPQYQTLNLNTNNDKLRHFTMNGEFSFPEKLLHSICASPNLKVLDLQTFDDFNDNHVHFIMETTSATLDHLRISSKCIINPIVQSDILTKLDLSGSMDSIPYINCPSLKFLDLTNLRIINDEHIVKILDNSPQLVELYLQGCKELRYPSFRKCKFLEKLDLGWCMNIDDNHLEEILESLSKTLLDLRVSSGLLTNPIIQAEKLVRLDLQNSHNCISFPSFRCPKLTYINLTQCPSLENEALVQTLINCPSLQMVVVD